MIKRMNKRAEGSGVSLPWLMGIIVVALMVAMVGYFIFLGGEKGSEIIKTFPGGLTVLISTCEQYVGTGGTQSLFCTDFKDIDSVKGVQRYGNCRYISQQYIQNNTKLESASCSGYDEKMLAKNVCDTEELDDKDLVNGVECSVWKSA